MYPYCMQSRPVDGRNVMVKCNIFHSYQLMEQSRNREANSLKKFHTFHETRRFSTMFARSCHGTIRSHMIFSSYFFMIDFNMTFMLGSSKRSLSLLQVFQPTFFTHFRCVLHALHVSSSFWSHQSCLAKGTNYDAPYYAAFLSLLLLHLY
jgi:hypothetical protein